MHEGVTDTEIKLDIVIKMALEHIPAQKFKQNTKGTGKVTYINECASMNAIKPGHSERRMF